MNSERLYASLISRAQSRDLDGYKERHHIVPKALGGSNNAENLVFLTAREHFLAHWLLWKIHGNTKMANAFFAMTRQSKGQQRSLSSRKYEIAKNAMAEAKRGENNHWFGTTGPMGGKKHADGFHERHSVIMTKHSEYKKGKPVSEVPGFNTGCGIATQWGNVPVWNKGKTGEASHMFGRKPSEETRAKMRGPKPRTVCPHCGLEGAVNQLKRWHFENCKKLKEVSNG